MAISRRNIEEKLAVIQNPQIKRLCIIGGYHTESKKQVWIGDTKPVTAKDE